MWDWFKSPRTASLWTFIYFDPRAPIIDREPFSSENSQKSEHVPEAGWNADDDMNQKVSGRADSQTDNWATSYVY